MKRIIFGLILGFILTYNAPLFAAEVTAAVAANFTKTIEEIGQSFTEDTGHTIRFSFGPTGKLFAQIKNNAPFDLFFAADEKAPQTAISENIALESSYFVYAQGILALYSPTLPVATQAEALLKQGEFRHLSMANPRVAPYGLQAENYLKALGVYENLKRKLVNGESIAHAFQYVITRNAELGFIALSQLVDPESPAYQKGEYFIVPQEMYAPINQAAVITKRGENNEAASAFMVYMKSPKAIAIMERYGYRIPE